jgi:hypothetical protein
LSLKAHQTLSTSPIVTQGLGTSYATSSAAQRDRMLQASERLEKSNQRIHDAKQQLAAVEVPAAPSSMTHQGEAGHQYQHLQTV